MEKVSKFKLLKIPSFFISSCKTQNLDEVIDHSKTPIFTLQKPFFTYEEEQQQINEKYPFNNIVIKPRKSSSSSTLMTCKPRCPKTFDQMVRENCIIPNSGKSPETRRKVTGRYSMLSPSGDVPGRQCPPSSPASPLFSKQGSMYRIKKKNEKGKKTHFNYNKKSNTPRYYNKFNYSSNESDYDKGDCFSSDDEKEENYYYDDDDDGKSIMFSLRSMSTFSSKSIYFSSNESDEFQTRTRAQTPARARPRGQTRPRRRKTGSRGKEVGVMALEKKVKDTYAIVKSSSDPYNDFRTSMVEMIIEKQIFGAKELEQLLECFLSLNSSHHHRVILEVFSEICDALFS